MLEELLTPNNVLKIWGRLPADDKAYAARQREAKFARVNTAVRAGTYDEAPGLDVAAGKLVDVLNRGPAETVNPDDQVVHYERFE